MAVEPLSGRSFFLLEFQSLKECNSCNKTSLYHIGISVCVDDQ